MSGTHKGEFMGAPATGKSFSVESMDIIRFAGGKAVEHWDITDQMGIASQLGLLPPQ
jgi:predicted ester cyclase